MHKHLLSSVAGVMLISGVAFAQTYPPPTPPPEIPAPSIRIPAPGTSTTTIAPSPYGGYQATTTRHGVDENGNSVTRKDIYREGIAGSSETDTTTATDLSAGGTTTTHLTTTNQR